MTKGHLDYAVREALNHFDKWNETAGAVAKFSSVYYEIQGVVEDAVHIGAQMALLGEVHKHEDGCIKRDYDSVNEALTID